jgi:hypothetical protein
MQKPLLESLEDRTLPSFLAPVVYEVGDGPRGVAVGDLRGNGHLDIVTANGSVLLGNGDGTFQPAVNFAGSGGFVALAKLRPNGPLDAIIPTGGTVSVFLGNGDGTFRPAVRYSVGPSFASAFAVAVGDFTGHGVLDLVTANFGDEFDPDSFSVLPGNGDGTFQTAVNHTVPFPVVSLAAGDFTGSGHFSIAIGSQGGAQVLLGNGDGTFQNPVFYATDPHSFVSVMVRDLAGTGRLDLVTGNPGSSPSTVSVLRGNGDGTFGPASNYSLKVRGGGILAAGRFRPGGPLDLVAAGDGNSVIVLPGAGDGTFGTPSQYPVGGTGPAGLAVGDFAGLGTDDIVATNPNLFSGAATVTVLLNQGDGTFPPPLSTTHFGQGAQGLATGDFRGIGVQDLVTTNQFRNSVSVYPGIGDGTFGPPRSFPAGQSPIGVVVGDFTGHGRLDILVIAPSGGSTLQLLVGNGDGTFQAPRSIPAGGVTLTIAAGHFHDPNILDLVTLDFQHNRANVLLGNGDGTFQAPVSYDVGRSPSSVAVGDLRGNGITDLVVANRSDATVSVLLGNGDGTFASAVNYPVGPGPGFVTVGSLRRNGRLDIVTTNGSPNVTVLLGNGDGTFGAPTRYDGGIGNNEAAIAAFNGDGIPDIVVTNHSTGRVSLLPGNGDGTFQPRLQFAVGPRPFALTVGDFNGDHLSDVAVLSEPGQIGPRESTIFVLLNDGRPSHASPGRGGFSNRSIPLTTKHSPAPGRIAPGVFSLLPSGARGPSSVDTTVRDQPVAVRQSQPETAAPLPAEGTVRQATDAVFADSHPIRAAIPSAEWDVEELELGLVSK